MSTPLSSQIDQICEKVERLLAHHERLKRSNLLLQEQVETIAQQRDTLESRLFAARARIDALLDRLPPPTAAAPLPALDRSRDPASPSS